MLHALRSCSRISGDGSSDSVICCVPCGSKQCGHLLVVIERGHKQPLTRESDDELMLNVLRCQLTYQGQFVTSAEARFNNSLRPRKPEGSLGRTAQDVHLDSHTGVTTPDLRRVNLHN